MKAWVFMAIAIALVPSSAGAQCDWAGAWWRSPALGQRIGLTAEQRARIDGMYEAIRPRLRELQNDLLQQQRSLDQLMREPDADRSAVDRSIEAGERARTALSKARATVLLDMRQVLDATQRRTLSELASAGCGGNRPSDRMRNRRDPGAGAGARRQGKLR